MKLAAGAAVVLAIGAGLGTYLLVDGSSARSHQLNGRTATFGREHIPDSRIMLIPKAGS